MLDNYKLKELNDSMLSLGAPIEKDNVGYNIGDFAVCYNMAYLPAVLYTPVMMYAITDRLMHYKNTQLKSYAAEIEETYISLKSHISDYEQGYYKDIIKDANIDYRPEVNGSMINFISFDESTGYLEVYHKGFSKKENEYKKEKKPLIKSIVNGSDSNNNPIWHTLVHMSIINEYKDLMTDAGYKLDDPFITFLSVIDRYKQITAEDVFNKELEVQLIKEKKEGLQLHFNGFVPDLKDFISEYNVDGAKWVKRDSAFDVFIPNHLYLKFKDTFTDKGYIFDKIGIDDNKFEDAYENFVNADKNPFTMIDVTKTDLPWELYPFQIEDISKAMEHKRVLMGHDMGAGKSVMSVIIGESIKMPKLIICPESLRLNWRKEIRQVRKDADVQILYSKDKIENFTFGEYTICGYQTAVKFYTAIMDQNFQCVFVDEVHNCKAINNSGKPSSKRAQAIIDIVNNAEFCYLLTGTPIPTRNKDLYNILTMLNAKVDKFFKFGLKYCDGYNNGFGWDFSGNSNSAPGKRFQMDKLYADRCWLPIWISD